MSTIARIKVFVWCVAGSVGCLVLLTAAPAVADVMRVYDPDDTAGALDIKVAGASHATTPAGTRLITHWVKMYEPWQNDVLASDSNELRLRFSTDADHASERVLRIGANPDGSLYSEMLTVSGRLLGYGRAWRPDQSTVKVAFPRRLLRKKLTMYSWDTDSRFSDPSAPECPGQQGDHYRYCADTAFGRHHI